MISQLVQQLAATHEFNFHPGESLWVAGIGNHGPLVLAVTEDGLHYVIARTYLYNKKTHTGFRVYYDLTWQPIAAVADDGAVVKDIVKADQVLCELIQKVYLHSDEAWIRKGEYPHKF